MKTLLVISSLTVLGVATAGVAAVADTPAPVRRSVIRAAEISIKQRLSGLFPDMAQSVTGDPRGVYLDGYGAVFTAEMEPVTDGTMMMHAVLRPDEKAAVLAKKKARIPEIRKAMKETLVETAASLDPVPLDEQVVLEIIIDRFLWEDGSGYPAELMVQASRRKLLDLKRNNNAGIDTVIRLTER